MIILDTNVFIEAFKGNPEAKSVLNQVNKKQIALSSITAMELYYGALNKRELQFIKRFLGGLNIILVNEAISSRAMSLVETFAKSHSLDIPDALIAATALEAESELFTYNVKDFRFIPELKLFNKF